MQKLIERIIEIANENQDGFTLNLKTMRLVKYGISVAYQETQNCFGKQGLEKALKHSLKHNHLVGGWFDKETNLYYLDSVKVFRNSEYKEAIQFMIDNNQIASYDITNGQPIINNEYQKED